MHGSKFGDLRAASTRKRLLFLTNSQNSDLVRMLCIMMTAQGHKGLHEAKLEFSASFTQLAHFLRTSALILLPTACLHFGAQSNSSNSELAWELNEQKCRYALISQHRTSGGPRAHQIRFMKRLERRLRSFDKETRDRAHRREHTKG